MPWLNCLSRLVRHGAAAVAMSALAGGFALPATAVELVVNGDGILTGARGVSVGGMLHNVDFIDGSCVTVFNICSSSQFYFTEASDAFEASRALEAFVFIDTVNGRFDSDPFKTNGCITTLGHCEVITPYTTALIPQFGFSVVADAFVNESNATPDTFGPFINSPHLFTGSMSVYAVWAPVPEPGTQALGLAGGAGLFATIRRRLRKAVGQ